MIKGMSKKESDREKNGGERVGWAGERQRLYVRERLRVKRSKTK